MRIKYMGSDDTRRLEKGETFGGQLSKEDALDRDIEWNWENNHIIDTDDPDQGYKGLSDAVISLLLDKSMKGEFKDVTNMARIPTNAAQQMWRGMPKSEEADPSVHESGTAETDETDETGTGPSEASQVMGAVKKAGARASSAT